MKKDIIMGVIRNYSFSKLEPFIRTLKNTGYKGDILFFYSEVPKKTLKKLRDEGIILVNLDIESLEHCLQFNEIEKIKYSELPLMSYRFIAYLDFLKKNKDKYRNAFLTDTRDVVFQKNPFGFNIGKNVCFFMLDINIHNWCSSRDNILSAYGKKMVEKTKGKKLSCAGTIIGETGEIIKYLQLMKKNIYKSNDQLIHSILLHSGWIENKKIFNNGDVVLTSGKDDLKKFGEVVNGEVVNKNREVVNIIHGYNHHRILVDLFNGNSRNVSICILKKFNLTHRMGRGIKSTINSLPFVGKFFRILYARFT